MPQYGRKHFQSVDLNKCLPGTSLNAATFHHCQVRVQMVGSLVINRLNIRFNLKPDGQLADCLGNNCEPIDCCPAVDDYAYHIAPEGVNNEVPVPPETPPPVFSSTRWVRLCCPNFQSICVNASGQGSSTISQADADTKAQAAASANAQALLVCPQQSSAILDDDWIDGGDIDYSSYFAAGAQSEFPNQPWRLQDVVLDTTIASGSIDGDGTMSTSYTNPAYTHGAFDPNTNIYTDAGGGYTRVALMVGTNFGGNYQWPSVGDYSS
jgi:hypothetical protein